MARNTDEAPDYDALAHLYAAKAAATAGGILGVNDKALRLAQMAQAFATVALLDREPRP